MGGRPDGRGRVHGAANILRERYAAGLTPLREALFQLVAEGLVTVEDQRGFRVGTELLCDAGALREEWVLVHREFHRVLVEACGSPRLLRFRELLSDQAERYRRWSLRQEPGRGVAGEHRVLAEAAVGRTADCAVPRLTEHYWRTARLCRLAVDPQAD